ncbi:hypothetical protein GCM10025331_47590 [Actinoplanes utahensis]|nr:hypothetical protein Aut01nite_26850 [Actinoplanes utahensis]
MLQLLPEPLVLFAAVLTALLFGGVVLPAVWSRRSSRRAAALAVLKALFRGRIP